MRIGIFTDAYPPFISGVVTSVLMLKKSLEEKGHEVYIITINDDLLKYDMVDDHIIKIPGIPTGIYDYRLSTIYPIKITKLIKKWELDVIHSHTEFSMGIFARLLAKQYNIPLVHTYHTMYEDYIYYVTKGYFDKPSKKLLEYLTIFYCDKTANELIVPTKKTYELFKDKYKIDKTINIIPTGIDTERFYVENIERSKIVEIKKKYNINKNDFTMLFVGRIAQEKNIEFLLKAMKKLISINNKIKLILVGTGPDLEKYQKYCNKNKLSENVTFMGKVPWEQIPVYYQCADIFVTASVTETQGLTVIEAMAGSLTPVCINDESFNTTIIDGLNGYLFDTEKEFVNKIIKIIDNPKELKQVSHQARIAVDRFSLKYYGESVLDVYKRAIKSNCKKDSMFKKFKDEIKKRLQK